VNTEIWGFIRHVLMKGCDDYVMPYMVVDSIYYLPAPFTSEVSEEILAKTIIAKASDKESFFDFSRNMNIRIARDVITNGYMVIGSLQDHFYPWNIDLNATMKRINSEWDKMAGVITPGIYYLRNTEKGEVVGLEALRDWKKARALSSRENSKEPLGGSHPNG